jgi:glycosyltransferase involved in cell wall biosynthesis
MSSVPPRTLVLTRRLPSPPRSGGDLRYLNIVGALAGLGPTYVFGLAGEVSPRDDLAGWRRASDLRAALTPTGQQLAATLRAGRSPFATVVAPATEAELAGVVEDFAPDLAVVCGLELVGYLDVLRPRVRRLVLDLDYAQARGLGEMAKADTDLRRALVWRHAISGVRRDETRATRGVDQIWMSTADEADHFVAQATTALSVAVVPNAIDVMSYERVQRPVRRSLLYTGRFDYWPNEEAARVLVRDVVPRLGHGFLALVGLAPPPWLRRLEDDRVIVTGAVPDVRPYLRAASVMPIPLVAGSGTRVKVLEAFASGVPVVSTTKGVEGLGLVAGQHYLRAEEPDAFVRAIKCLEDDPAMAQHYIEEAMVLVRHRFSLDALRRAVAAALAWLEVDRPSG